MDTSLFHGDLEDDDDSNCGDIDDRGPPIMTAGGIVGGSNTMDEPDFGESLVAEPKRAKALQINYAKTAKKVDVKKLKSNIWKGLTGDLTNKTVNMKLSFFSPTLISTLLNFVFDNLYLYFCSYDFFLILK